MQTNTDRYTDIKEKLCGYAQKDDDIRAVIAIGSSTREDTPADEYSDLDLFIITRAPDRWFSGEYPRLLGNVSISFIEPTLGGGRERRCIYDNDRDVDMIILTPEQFDAALKEGVAQWVMNRGYKFLCDKEKCTACGLCERICPRDNIKRPEGSPVWEHRCVECLGCLHICPAKAIEYGEITKGRKRYRHKAITPADLLRKG